MWHPRVAFLWLYITWLSILRESGYFSRWMSHASFYLDVSIGYRVWCALRLGILREAGYFPGRGPDTTCRLDTVNVRVSLRDGLQFVSEAPRRRVPL